MFTRTRSTDRSFFFRLLCFRFLFQLKRVAHNVNNLKVGHRHGICKIGNLVNKKPKALELFSESLFPNSSISHLKKSMYKGNP